MLSTFQPKIEEMDQCSRKKKHCAKTTTATGNYRKLAPRTPNEAVCPVFERPHEWKPSKIKPAKTTPHVFEHPYQFKPWFDPSSPTANLKMLAALTTAATTTTTKPKKSGIRVKRAERQQIRTPLIENRKERSLGLLTKKFVSLAEKNANSNQNGEINLENIHKCLNTSRRRIYDIVNVLESVKVVYKIHKNRYNWLGIEKLAELMAQIKKEAEILDYPNRVKILAEMHRHARKKSSGQQLQQHSDRGRDRSESKNCQKQQPIVAENFFEVCVSSSSFDDSFLAGDQKRLAKICRPSLKAACRHFLMLLLSTPYPHELCVDVATFMLVNICSSSDNLNSTTFQKNNNFASSGYCRRLYDVTNVLASIGLIRKKRRVGGSFSPALIYAGPCSWELDEAKSFFEKTEILANQSIKSCDNDSNDSQKSLSPVDLKNNDENRVQSNKSPGNFSFTDVLKAAELERTRLLSESEFQTIDGIKTNKAENDEENAQVVSSQAVNDQKLALRNGRRLRILTKSGSTLYVQVISRSPESAWSAPWRVTVKKEDGDENLPV